MALGFLGCAHTEMAYLDFQFGIKLAQRGFAAGSAQVVVERRESSIEVLTDLLYYQMNTSKTIVGFVSGLPCL